MLVRLTGLKSSPRFSPVSREDAIDLLWNRTGNVIYQDCVEIVNHLAGGGHSYIHLFVINEELLRVFDAEKAPSGHTLVGNVDGPVPTDLKLFRGIVPPKKNIGKPGTVNGRQGIEILVLAFDSTEAFGYMQKYVKSLGQLFNHIRPEHILYREVVGPFKSGDVIAGFPHPNGLNT